MQKQQKKVSKPVEADISGSLRDMEIKLEAAKAKIMVEMVENYFINGKMFSLFFVCSLMIYLVVKIIYEIYFTSTIFENIVCHN